MRDTDDPVIEEPRIRPGLVLKITVVASGKKEFEELDKRVSDTGSITMPLVGIISVTNLTLGQVATNLQSLYSEYLLKPSVNVDFVIDSNPDSVSPWGSITVMGRVKSPGRVNIPPTMDLYLSKAVQLAGGFDTSPKLTQVIVTRQNTDGTTRRFEVDMQAIGAQGKMNNDMLLRAGDVIFVPERVF